MKKFIKPAAVLVIAAVILLGIRFGLAGAASASAEAAMQDVYKQLLPGSTSFTEEEYSGEDANITAVYKGDDGYIIETTTAGYVNDIVLLTGVQNDGTVSGILPVRFRKPLVLVRMQEKAAFLGQFLGINSEAAVGEEIDAVTGATVTSKAVTKGVNSAVAFVTGADVSSGATEWEG